MGSLRFTTGNDTGADNSTIMKLGMPLATPDIAAYLVLQLESLAQVAERLGRRWDVALWREESARLLRRHLDLQWRAGEPAPSVRDMAPCRNPAMPAAVDDGGPGRTPARCQTEGLREGAHASGLFAAGLATEALTSPLHERDGYWRGPVWAPTRCSPATAAAHGTAEAGIAIAADFVGNCRSAGFAENFAAGQWRAAAAIALTHGPPASISPWHSTCRFQILGRTGHEKRSRNACWRLASPAVRQPGAGRQSVGRSDQP